MVKALTEEQKMEITELLKLGFSKAVIAQKVGCTAPNISNFVALAGLRTHAARRRDKPPKQNVKEFTRRKNQVRQFSGREDALLEKLHSEGKTVPEMASALKRNRSSIFYRLKLLERDKGENK